MKLKTQITNLQYFLSGQKVVSDKDFVKSLKLKNGDYLEIETWKERNVGFHRKYFALINCTINHLPENMTDEFRNIDNLRRYVTILTGRFDLVPSLKGDPIPQAHSISFRTMDNEAFEHLYKESLHIILKHFLKGMDVKDFENDILNFF
jgi:hypothetical protein